MCEKRSTSYENNLFYRECGSLKSINFKYKINQIRLQKLSLSKIRDVKVVSHGAISTVAIDPLGNFFRLLIKMLLLKNIYNAVSSIQTLDKFYKISRTTMLMTYFWQMKVSWAKNQNLLLILFAKYSVSQENPGSLKNRLLLKNPRFLPNHYKTLSKYGTSSNKDLILTKFPSD